MSITSKRLAKALISSLNSDAFEEFVERNHLGALMPNVVKNLERMSAEIKNENTALILVSHKISDTHVKLIEKLIEKEKSHPVKVEVDESLLGGFKAYYRGKVFDGSVKNYLKDLRLTLMK